MTTLVTGATANIGRYVVDHLLAEGVTDIRALTVSPARAALPDGVEPVVGHIGRPHTLDGVFDGVERMYLAPAAEAGSTVEAMRLAVAAGVRQVVATDGPPQSWWGDQYRAVEGAVEVAGESGGLEVTHLWPGEFMENFTMWSHQTKVRDVVRDAYPDAANAAIAMTDIAAVAARCLTSEGHAGRSYGLTGPDSLTRRQRVAAIAEALGRPILYEEVSREEAIVELEPEMGESAAWYVDLQPLMIDGPQPVDPTFEHVMGAPATSFVQWVRDHASRFQP